MRDEARAAGKYDAAISAEHKRGLCLGFYVSRAESGAVGAFQAKTMEEADRVLEETIAKIAAKQAVEKAQKGPATGLRPQSAGGNPVTRGNRSDAVPALAGRVYSMGDVSVAVSGVLPLTAWCSAPWPTRQSVREDRCLQLQGSNRAN
jgi:hypothetical protein